MMDFFLQINRRPITSFIYLKFPRVTTRQPVEQVPGHTQKCTVAREPQVSQYLSNFDFSTFSQLINVKKSRSRHIFADPCKNRELKLNYVRIFQHYTYTATKLYKTENQFLQVQVLQNIISQYPFLINMAVAIFGSHFFHIFVP